MAPKNLTDRLLDLLQQTSPLSRDDAAQQLGVPPKSLAIPINNLIKLGQIEVLEDKSVVLVTEPPSDVELVRNAVAKNRTCQVRPFATGIISYDVPLKNDRIQDALEEMVQAGELTAWSVEDDEDDDLHDFYSRHYLTPAVKTAQDKDRQEAEQREAARQLEAELNAKRDELVSAMLRLVWPDGLDVDDVSRAGALRADLTKLVIKHDL